MRKLEIKKVWLRRACNHVGVSDADRVHVNEALADSEGQYTLEFATSDMPFSIWRAVLRQANLPSKTRVALTLHVFGMRSQSLRLQEFYDFEVSNPLEFGSVLQSHNSNSPIVEIHLNGRWYPIQLEAKFIEGEDKITRAVDVQCYLQIGSIKLPRSFRVANSYFDESKDGPKPKTMLEILECIGFRKVQISAAEHNIRLCNAERLGQVAGQLCMVTGPAIASEQYSWWRGYEAQALGTPEMPARCIVEPDLESDERRHYSHHQISEDNITILPFVRVFSLETKSYVCVDIDDIAEYEFDHDAIQRLHLPPRMHSILQRVFETPVERMFGDILQGKHGGAVVLASGGTGVGKTLTAEIYAELSERPLYVLELGELGTRAEEVETNLQLVFARVTRWNAVLQFDECEIFLANVATIWNGHLSWVSF